MLPSKEEMRLRFWALKTAVEATEATVIPLREARDAAMNAARDADAVAMAEIHAAEADVIEGMGMFDAKQEMAFLARGLGNQVGEDPAA